MQHLPKAAIVIIMMTSMIASGKELYGKRTLTDVYAQTVTQSAQDRVKRIKKIPRFNLLRSNPFRLTSVFEDPDNEVFVDDDGLISGRRRRDVHKTEHRDGISPRIKWKLFLARQVALIKYREKWMIEEEANAQKV